VDVGGTKVAAGLVDEAGRVLATARRATPGRDVRAVEDTVVEVVHELAARAAEEPGARTVGAVGVGAAGFVGRDRSTVMFSPHLAWRDEPLGEALSARLGRPVLVDNDANGAAWAEWRFGAGRGEPLLVCLTLGTGIGGAVVVDGRLERGRHGLAGEFGHMVLVPGGHRCECGNRGCWEQYASGNALGREGRELARAGSPVAYDLLRGAGQDPDAITGADVTAAALEGDPASCELVAEMGRWFGIGLANLAAALDPGTFVVGGGLGAAGELLLGPARAALAATLTGRGHRPVPVVTGAALGAEAGLVGMADLARGAAA
jgi:glucokinase